MNEILSGYVGKIDASNIPWIPYGLVEGTEWRVLKADEDNNIVILNFRMPPHCVTQSHDHYCNALAYTVSGEWMYGEQVFRQGDVAYEFPGEVHQPVTGDHSAELLTVMIGRHGEPRFLRNFEEDGSSYAIGINFMKAYEGVTPEEASKINPVQYLLPVD